MKTKCKERANKKTISDLSNYDFSLQEKTTTLNVLFESKKKLWDDLDDKFLEQRRKEEEEKSLLQGTI